MIDWNDPKSKLSKFFTIGDATLLPRFGIHHIPSDSEKANILKAAEAMDKIRDLINAPIIVNVWIRPTSINCPGSSHHGENYNALIGGAPSSSHIDGQAVDFHSPKYTIDQILDMIQPSCAIIGMALENNGTAERIAKNNGTGGPRNWVHVQVRSLAKAPPFRMFNP